MNLTTINVINEIDKKSIDKDNPIVTVIIPTYYSNKKYLFEAIDSILMQTYNNIELIITDDGTKDFIETEITEYIKINNSGNIVNCNILKHEFNVGTVKNLNHAISLAMGEYIFDIGHDDVYYDSDVILDWVNEFKLTGALLITSRMIPYNNKNITYNLKVYYDKIIKKIQLSSPLMLESILCAGDTISAPATAQSKICFQKYGLYDEKYRLMEDYPRWLKLARLGLKFNYLDRVVVKYRTDGMSNNRSINIDFKKEELFAFEDILKYYSGLRRCAVYVNIVLMRLIINHLDKKSSDGHHAAKDITIIMLEIFELTHKLLSNIFIIIYVNTIQLISK